MRSTRSLVSALITSASFNALDTVAVETPAAFATSLIVTFAIIVPLYLETTGRNCSFHPAGCFSYLFP